MADIFGTQSLAGFSYYDRMPDLGHPISMELGMADQSNIAAPFVVVFDKMGVRSIANVGEGMEENQQGLGPQMFMAKSKSDIHYFFIFLRPSQVRRAEQLWVDAEYCDLYDYLKEIALTEEGAFGGEDGVQYYQLMTTKRKDSSVPYTIGWFGRKDIRATEAVMNIHCEPDEEEEEPEKPSLGSLNWVSFSSENKVRGKIGREEFLVWGARDGRSRVLGRPMEDWIWDKGEFEDEEQYEEFQRQVEQYGAYSLQHEIWDDEVEAWEDIDQITGIVPSDDYDLIQAGHEFFDLKNPILLGGLNWISLRAENLWKAEFGAESYDYRNQGVWNDVQKTLAMQFGLDGEGFVRQYEPFMFSFDSHGVKQIANVETRYPYNQQQFKLLISPDARKVMSQKTNGGLHGGVIWLDEREAQRMRRLWKNAQYCRLYRELKKIAFKEGESRPDMMSLHGGKRLAESFFNNSEVERCEHMMEIDCRDGTRIDHRSKGLLNWDSFTRGEDFDAEDFPEDEIGLLNWRWYGSLKALRESVGWHITAKSDESSLKRQSQGPAAAAAAET